MAIRSRIVALLGAVSFSALASSAHAADPAVEMPVRTGFNWTGFHIGAAVGAGAFLINQEDVDVTFLSGDGVFGEISAGYDYMFSERFLLGAFVDARYGGQGSSFAVPGNVEFSIDQTYGFDVGLRAGYLLNPYSLAYVLGGYSWQRFEGEMNISGVGTVFSDEVDGDGFTVGAGLETVIGGNWTLKNEYRYASYSMDDEAGTGDIDTHTYRIGVNYRFGAEGGAESTFAAPVYNWTGFYVGAQVGAAAAIDEFTDLGPNVIFDGLGGDGGWGSLNIGYDYEFGGAWVAGVQAAARYMSLDTTFDGLSLDRDYGFDLLARVGAKVNESTLAYVIGGYTHQHFELDVQGEEFDWNDGGYTIGAGIETAVSSNLTLNVEYRFSQFGDHEPLEDVFPGEFSYEPRFHTFGVGLKYKFNN
jgi:outer membrane immunogenic protein